MLAHAPNLDLHGNTSEEDLLQRFLDDVRDYSEPSVKRGLLSNDRKNAPDLRGGEGACDVISYLTAVSVQ